MKTYTSLVLAVLVPLCLWSCAKTPQRPDWVAATSTQYQAARYLLGRGEADRAAVARDRARADLAKNFQVQVTEESRDLLAYSSSGSGETATSALEKEVSRSIVSRTDQVIEGVRIAEAWYDEAAGRHHALAVLDRLQASNQLRQLIAELDQETAAEVQRARADDDLLRKIGAASRALAAQVERRHYGKYLLVVDRTGMGATASYDPATLKADLAELLARVRIAPQVEDDALGGLERSVSGALAGAGFLHETGPSPSHRLSARTRVEETVGGDGWHWVRGHLELTLQSAADDRVVGTHRWPIKSSAQQAAMARLRAAEQVETMLKRDLRDVIVAFGAPAAP